MGRVRVRLASVRRTLQMHTSACPGRGESPFGAPVDLMGLLLDPVTAEALISWVLHSLDAGRGGWVMTPNLDHLRRVAMDADLRALADQADIRVADGAPLVWASRLRGTPLPCRVAGSDVITSLSQALASKGRSVFLLGGAPGAAERAAGALADAFPGLTVAGTYCPPLGFEQDVREMEEIRGRVTESQADVVYVGLPFPKADRLIVDLRQRLPRTWFLGLGISFSFVAGDLTRASTLLQGLGLEWTHRLIQEPRRLFVRYMVHGIPFGLRLLVTALTQRRRLRRANLT